MPQPTFEELVANNRRVGFNADTAFTLAAKQDPQAYQAYLREARDKKQAPVQKDVPLPKAAPQHWSLVKLVEMKEQLLQKSAKPLSDSEAWDAVLKTDNGKLLWREYYQAHPHLRRQG
jgi:hypothetical protein